MGKVAGTKNQSLRGDRAPCYPRGNAHTPFHLADALVGVAEYLDDGRLETMRVVEHQIAQ